MISFTAPSRNTKCYELQIGDLHLTISYETVVAASDRSRRVRLKNIWGPTTGRHLKESGAYGFEVVPNEEFERFIQASLIKTVLSRVEERLGA